MRYVLYARKSTEEDDRQVLSVEAQITELKEFAAKEKLEIVYSFQESKTAKEPGRTKFAGMLELIEKGKAEGILSWHPDRLARNSVDGGKIIHMVDTGFIKSLRFPSFWFEPTPQGLFMLNIAFGQSKYFVDNLRENVKRGLRQKIRNGVWPGWAPVGYLNNPKTRMIDVDENKTPKLRKLFELYAKGDQTLYSLANWSKENKLKSNNGKDLRVGGIHKILQNIFYIGLMKFNGEIHEGKHKAIISKKLFDACQEVLSKRGKVQEVRKHHFAFLGLMKCKSCGCSITGERQKGHNYYRCTKKKGICQEKHYLREESLVEQMQNFLQKVSLSSQDSEKVLFELEKEEIQAKEQAKTTVQNLKVKLDEITKQLEKLLQNRKWHFEAKIPYNLVAAEGGANSQNLTFPIWCPREDSNPQALADIPLMARRGVEPLRPCGHQLLRLKRLPVPPPRQFYGNFTGQVCHFATSANIK
ncbi:MAG: recombinase [Candidatus Berkelbacteria bacterium Licking1014_7]|uniref:Recombinase n=1 Tax=Candidatus Berkelbacteria bacterium Licking1014_7 TaxID=2017147 RepID=A0A554LIR7_9BACT|nr:MAG: recombinase [Candidatus Berkelbacteria bacterium Licking1014_7]